MQEFSFESAHIIPLIPLQGLFHPHQVFWLVMTNALHYKVLESKWLYYYFHRWINSFVRMQALDTRHEAKASGTKIYGMECVCGSTTFGCVHSWISSSFVLESKTKDSAIHPSIFTSHTPLLIFCHNPLQSFNPTVEN